MHVRSNAPGAANPSSTALTPALEVGRRGALRR